MAQKRPSPYCQRAALRQPRRAAADGFRQGVRHRTHRLPVTGATAPRSWHTGANQPWRSYPLRIAGLSSDALEVSWSSPMSEVRAVGKPHRVFDRTQRFIPAYKITAALPIINADARFTGRRYGNSQAGQSMRAGNQTGRCGSFSAFTTDGRSGRASASCGESREAVLQIGSVHPMKQRMHPLGSRGLDNCPAITGTHLRPRTAVPNSRSIYLKMRFHAVPTASTED